MTHKKILLERYLEQNGFPTKKNAKFSCMNPEHEDKNPSMSYNPKNGTVHCFSCGKTYDIYSILMDIEGISSFPEAKKVAELRYGNGIENQKTDTLNPEKINIKDENIPEYIKRCHNELLQNKKAIDYLMLKRGLKKNTINEYVIGFDNLRNSIVFPYDKKCTYYMRRNIEEKSFYLPKGLEEPIFNYEILDNLDDSNVLFVCESIICALSVWQYSSLNVIALCGTGNHKFIESIKDKNICVLLCMDKDDAGNKATKRISSLLDNENIDWYDVRFENDYKDPNEFLINDKDNFLNWILNLEERVEKHKKRNSLIGNMSKFLFDMIEDNRINDIEKEYYQTGFKYLDEKIHLRDDLVVLGGIPSSGKSTFAFQLAEQMSNKYPVFYFTMEQSKEELILSMLKRKRYNNGLTQIGAAKAIIEENLNLNILELNGKGSLNRIIKTIENYEIKSKKKPVIFIDYLQLLQTDDTFKLSAKERIDKIVSELKEFSREKKYLIFIISSLNRTNYLQNIDFDSFKETGGIEYSCSVVLGLQYSIIHSKTFLNEGNVNNKRELLNKEREKKIREMEIICVKNRNGETGWNLPYSYTPSVCCFRERKSANKITEKRI